MSQPLSPVPGPTQPARPEDARPRQPPAPGPPPLPRPAAGRRDRPLVNLALLLATIGSTTWLGARLHQTYTANLHPGTDPPFVLWHGLWYGLTVLAILGVHELGHYWTCRRYRIDVSLPYFLPAPGLMIGTLGAFIRLREAVPTKRMLFDIGVAGPIAGFAVAVPALFLGVGLSPVMPPPEVPDEGLRLHIGLPLLFRLAVWTVWGAIPEGHGLNLHPMLFAAWVGLLATALNLFPIGQLDGGHISYAVFGSRSTLVTLGAAAVLFALAFHSPSWIVWAVLMVVMLFTLGPRHPRTLDHYVPLDRTRLFVAAFALVIFVLCFTPAPVQIVGDFGD